MEIKSAAKRIFLSAIYFGAVIVVMVVMHYSISSFGATDITSDFTYWDSQLHFLEVFNLSTTAGLVAVSVLITGIVLYIIYWYWNRENVSYPIFPRGTSKEKIDLRSIRKVGISERELRDIIKLNQEASMVAFRAKQALEEAREMATHLKNANKDTSEADTRRKESHQAQYKAESREDQPEQDQPSDDQTQD